MDFNKLALVVDEINKKGIRWVAGSSIVLYFYRLIENPNDLDIFIHENDALEMDSFLSDLGEKKPNEYREPFKTKYFTSYTVFEVDVDLMGGFAISHPKGVYKFIFDEKAITSVEELNGIKIPLSSLEDWFILYQLMPGREKKVKLIEQYFYKHGVMHEELLKRALEQELPDDIKNRINRLL